MACPPRLSGPGCGRSVMEVKHRHREEQDPAAGECRQGYRELVPGQGHDREGGGDGHVPDEGACPTTWRKSNSSPRPLAPGIRATGTGSEPSRQGFSVEPTSLGGSWCSPQPPVIPARNRSSNDGTRALPRNAAGGPMMAGSGRWISGERTRPTARLILAFGPMSAAGPLR